MFDLGRGLRASARRRPDAIALSDGDRQWTYAAWYADAQKLAQGLLALGIEPGRHLVTLLTNRAEAATLHLACQLAGIVITPLNWRASAGELDYVLNDCDAAGLVFEPLTAGTVAESANAAREMTIGLDGVEAAFALETLSAASGASQLPAPDATRLSVMLYTSGTTGRGKGVPRTHAAERAAALAHVAQNQYAPGEVTLGVMPLYHTMGVRSLLASILLNGHFVCQRRFDPDTAIALINRHRITNLYLVPTLYHDLLHAPAFAVTDTSSVTKLGFAGQSMTDGLLRDLAAAFEPELFVNHYGSSEIYTFTVESDASAKPGSAGKAGLNQEIRVIALDSTNPDEEVSAHVEGQIIAALDGDESFAGYWRRPDADARALHDGWYFTGDIGYTDADGDLFVTGRVDDMIISGGENILPVEIESVLSLHAGVSEVAVVGLPDDRWGQAVSAFIVRRGGVDEAELDAWCRNSGLAGFKRPRRYTFVRQIPKSPVGKLLRRKLVDGDYELE
ncbi:MAG: AMP-binding protein [Pseudomonadota bacterium]